MFDPMNAERLTELIGDRRLLLALNVVLAVCLAASALYFIRDAMTLSFSPKEAKTSAPAAASASQGRSLNDYAGILRNNPFGFQAGELKPIAAATSGESAARTDLTLIGAISGSRGMNYAVFTDRTGRQDVFRAGEKVYGLGILSEVRRDSVVLKSGGRETVMKLADVASIREVRPEPGDSGGFGKKTGDSNYQIDQQKVQQAIDKPDQIMTDARFIPNIVDGKQQGFTLREVKPGGIYQSLGLQNGDVLLRVNEYAITNPETALQAFTALRGIDRAQLDIIRGGNRMTMNYQIR